MCKLLIPCFAGEWEELAARESGCFGGRVVCQCDCVVDAVVGPRHVCEPLNQCAAVIQHFWMVGIAGRGGTNGIIIDAELRFDHACCWIWIIDVACKINVRRVEVAVDDINLDLGWRLGLDARRRRPWGRG